MSAKTDVGIFYSEKSSMVTIHKITSLTISIKLDEANYCVWSQILEIHIAYRKKNG